MKNRNRSKYTFANINFLGKCNLDCFFCLGKDLENEFARYDYRNTYFDGFPRFEEFLLLAKQYKIQQLYTQLKEGAIQAYILEPVLEEVAYHICVTYGKAKVDSYVRSFLQQYHITIVQPTLDLVTESGILKCKYRTFLSYYDALLISYCLKEKIEIHTTEKRLRTKFRPDIANKLKIISYSFD